MAIDPAVVEYIDGFHHALFTIVKKSTGYSDGPADLLAFDLYPDAARLDALTAGMMLKLSSFDAAVLMALHVAGIYQRNNKGFFVRKNIKERIPLHAKIEKDLKGFEIIFQKKGVYDRFYNAFLGII
ncbi:MULTISPECIES: hypothetical protein [unclassified Pseudomonas]|uniref:hypothetical protein n=1 Tax=unclassified Pseudomonas TaxID=196821 RepID=UPI00128CD775|nr:MULTISPECIES: hypothetical protein [unclassified Pseudomonas]MPQ67797.1 hypothetical protein [Pseudomonas sp. MWU12-2323]